VAVAKELGRGGEQAEMSLPPTGGRGYRLGLGSVRGIGDSRFGPQIFSASLKVYGFGPFTVPNRHQFFAPSTYPVILWFCPFYGRC
jgi:hypothetical protein